MNGTDNGSASASLYEVYRAGEEDIEDIVRLEERIFSTPWSETSLREALSDGYLLAALREKTDCMQDTVHNVLGYAVLDMRIRGEAELLRIAVRPENRGRGCASALMEYLISSAGKSHADRIMLEVRAANATAIALYGKYGFTVDGIRKGYYRFPSEDAVLMSLNLKSAASDD